MNRVYSNKTQGFTLVELLVVMLVLVALSSITLDFTKDFAFQGRYEVTKDRYDKIKRAIIGRPDVLINGQPDISGFVADMGRLPNNIRELLDADYCLPDRRIDDDGINFDTGTYATAILDCNTTYGGGSWVVQNNWNGPYLTSTKGVTEGNAFSDGWGSVPTDYCTDLNFTGSVACAGAGDTWVTAIQNHNYGWYYFVDTSVTPNELHFFSLGKDGKLNGNDYDKDYPNSINHPNEPPVLRASDWTVDIPSGLIVKIQTPIIFTSCDITNLATKSACDAVGQLWFPANRCENIIVEVSCTPAPLIWDTVNSVCFDASKDNLTCTDVDDTWNLRPAACESFIGTSCVSPSFTWDGSSVCTSNSKEFCDSYVTTPSGFNTQDIDLEITYLNNSATTTATVEENGLYQNVVFNKDLDSDGLFFIDADDDGIEDGTETDISEIPQSIVQVNIFKKGTSDIYPASCSGLIQSNCEAADGGVTPTTTPASELLSNSMCDNLTITECTDAGGKLIRNTQNILIVPHKNIGTINW